MFGNTQILFGANYKNSGTSSERTIKSSGTDGLSSEKAKDNSEKILGLIRRKPTISAIEIAKLISMSSRAVEKHIRKLREAGVLKRIGADKGGYWEILQ